MPLVFARDSPSTSTDCPVRSLTAGLIALACCAALLGGCGSIPEGAPDAARGDAGSGGDGPEACEEGARACSGDSVVECRRGQWEQVQTCASLCSGGGCIAPASCGGGLAVCGEAGTESCCRSLRLERTAFVRSYDGVSPGFVDLRYEAEVGPFQLDKYEVTAGRFAAFLKAYPANKPVMGAGRNPRDALDPGWLESWTVELPPTSSAVRQAMRCDGLGELPAAEPVRCVTWYLAQAFCIWDGGRLPTEAEWNAAATGGDQQRVYPWSAPPSSSSIDSTHLVFRESAPLRPGSRPLGNGRFGHADLSGNVAEWVFDYYASPYPSDRCIDCANRTPASFRGLRGGGYFELQDTVLASYRSALGPSASRAFVGFRCARDPSS